MRAVISKQEEVEYKNKGFQEIFSQLSREDISTLVEVYLNLLESHDPRDVQDVLKSPEGYFLFVVDSNKEGKFDFYAFLNSHYSKGVDINLANAKYLFPRGLSLGLYPDDERVAQQYEEEESTGFMDEPPIEVPQCCFSLLHKRLNHLISVPSQGLVLGRSARTADYIIEGNINVSRNHARIEIEGTHLKVTDLKASNGTFVNGLRVQGTSNLNLGDTLSLANEDFIVK